MDQCWTELSSVLKERNVQNIKMIFWPEQLRFLLCTNMKNQCYGWRESNNVLSSTISIITPRFCRVWNNTAWLTHPGNCADLSGDLTLLPAGVELRTAGPLLAQRWDLARSASPPGHCHKTHILNGSAVDRVGLKDNPAGEGDDLGVTAAGSLDHGWK